MTTTATQVLTPEFRLSFSDLFKPTVNSMDDEGSASKTPKYRLEMLFPKSIAMSELAGMKAIYDAKVKPEWIAGGLEYRKFNAAFINGDKKKQEGRKGSWILRATSGEEYPPRLLLQNKATATKRDLYSGCYCRAILTAFHWEHTNSKGVVIKRGVSFNIATVQKTRDGERFGAFVSEAEQDALLDSVPLDTADADDLLG